MCLLFINEDFTSTKPFKSAKELKYKPVLHSKPCLVLPVTIKLFSLHTEIFSLISMNITADKISLTFTLLDLSPREENEENECSYNFVAVHDGDNTNSTVISRVCGTKVPPVLRSSGSALTVCAASLYTRRSHLGRFTAMYSTYSTGQDLRNKHVTVSLLLIQTDFITAV